MSPRGDLDEVLPELAGDVREHDMAVGKLHLEHRAREHGDDLTFHFESRCCQWTWETRCEIAEQLVISSVVKSHL